MISGEGNRMVLLLCARTGFLLLMLGPPTVCLLSCAYYARHVRLEWAEKLGLKSFELGGPYDKALDAVCERLGVS